MFRSIYNAIFDPPFSQELIPHPNTPPIQQTLAGHHKVGFDDICAIMKRGATPPTTILLINTLPIHDQDNLILHTVPCHTEETTINNILSKRRLMDSYTIILYGRNCADDTVDKKFKQLQHLGFTNVFIYYGGMFEWMLLQDVYGATYFPTTKTQEKDPLKYMAKRKLP
jgi:hypothetical protein